MKRHESGLSGLAKHLEVDGLGLVVDRYFRRSLLPLCMLRSELYIYSAGLDTCINRQFKRFLGD